MTGRAITRRAVAAAAIIALGWLAAGEARALNRVVRDSDEKRLSAHDYYTLMPFVIPVVDKGEHRRQLTLVIAIELGGSKDRDEIERLSPRFRDHIYQVLFRLITFRTATPRIPPKSMIERKLLPGMKKVGGKLVKAVVVHTSMLERRS